MEYDHVEFTNEDVTRHAANVYNYHRDIQTEPTSVEEVIDHTF